MKRLVLMAILLLTGLYFANAQALYKMYEKQEAKDATYTKKEKKKNLKEYSKLIYEDAKEVFKERKDWMKSSEKKKTKKKKDIFAIRMLSYRQDRWKVLEGKPSLEEQCMKEIDMALNYDDSLFPIDIEGQAKSIAKTYEVALEKALFLARENLVSTIQHEAFMQLAKADFVKSFGVEKAQIIVEAVHDAYDYMLENLGESETVMEFYNSSNHNSSEVMVRVFYPGAKAKGDFKEAIQKTLAGNDNLLKWILTLL